jgi:endonuclease/exonuclease/phosphatase family metal-dependent hydrolase
MVVQTTALVFADALRRTSLPCWLGLVMLMGCGTSVPKVPRASTGSETPQATNEERLEKTFEVEFLSWNIESDGSDPAVIGGQLAGMKRYDIYAFSEVLPAASATLESALGAKYTSVISKSGFSDRLAIFYDQSKFEEIKRFEISEINFRHRYRAPLVVHLKHRASEVEFLVMNNHLARGKAPVRQEQATKLVEWARTQLLPVVALGDYNFDYVFETKTGNRAFSNMLHDNVWQWVRPEEWIDTNWYDDPREPDGDDDYPGSMLDFAFVSGPAKAWKKRCRVIVRDGDFPDDESTSDHRPFELFVAGKLPDPRLSK